MVIPERGQAAWLALSAALDRAGVPVACESLPDAWFEPGPLREQARAMCHRCPVVVECLAYAAAAGERFGLWGGLDELERRERV